MLILFSARLANEKSAKALHYLSSIAWEDRIVNLITKSAVIPTLVQYNLT
jgi:hypothetical protein